MSQIGEPVTMGMVDEDELKCPFDHDFEPLTIENDLIGVGGTLGRRMESPVGTHKYAGKCANLDGKFCEEYPKKGKDEKRNPKHISGHPFFSKNKQAVKLLVQDGDKTITHYYPVSCAAHHAIPAQESLKESPLLAFMCKKGSATENNHKYADGQVWSNVGYDVNGAQNGIFLPGSYAVGGGRGGMGVWASTEDGDDDGPVDPMDSVADPESIELSGNLNEITFTNRKWRYVSQAVVKCPGQFHDRHVDYSQFVQSALNKIHENYVNLFMEAYLGEKCADCKKRAERFEKEGIPTPYGLVSRLNKVSAKFMNFLNGTTWRMNIFTSKWGQAYMVAEEAGIPAARVGTDSNSPC